MIKIYDLKLTREEVEAIAADGCTVAIERKARLLLEVIEASEEYTATVKRCEHEMHNAKERRKAVWKKYNSASVDGIVRDEDGIPVLPV